MATTDQNRPTRNAGVAGGTTSSRVVHPTLDEPVPQLLLTPDEARIALRISARELWGMTASGEIPHVRLGRCLRYSFDDLKRFIEEQKQ